MENPVPKEVVDPLCTAVGYVVINWAFVEGALDTCINTIYLYAGGRHVETELPGAISRKITFVRRCLKSIDALGPFKDEGIALLKRVNVVKDTRHMVVHGCVTKYEPKDHRFTFTKIEPINNRTDQELNRLTITAQKLMEDGSECLSLWKALIQFSHRLMDAFPR